MLKKSFAVCLLLVLGAVMYVGTAHAEVTFKYGAALRLRQEIWDDVVNLGTGAPDRNFLRLRTSAWGRADFTQDTGVYLKLTNEAKYYALGPYQPNGLRNDDSLDEDELIIDNLYLEAKNMFGLPVDLKVGRQDFLGVFGEGFLIMDGTPGDGSRSFYFNAARATVKFNKDINLDLVYISDPMTDLYLPSMHPGKKKRLTGSDEEGFVAYGRAKLVENLTIEPYYVFKTEDIVGRNPELDLNTVGMRAVYGWSKWKIGAEYAHQFGEYDGGRDRRGDGGYIFVSGKYDEVTWKPEFELRYVYLSGDDPGSSKHEGWNPLFSRNPYWNELIIYTYITETAKDGGPIPGYWTNLNLYKAAVKLNFTADTALALSYQYLTAPEKTKGLPSTMFSNDDTARGHLPTAIATHKFSKNLDAMVQLEMFFPEDFYSKHADNATFFRWQLQYKL